MKVVLVLMAILAVSAFAEQQEKPTMRPIIQKKEEAHGFVKVITVPKGDLRARAPVPAGCPKCQCNCGKTTPAPAKNVLQGAKRSPAPARKNTAPAKKNAAPAKKTSAPAKKTSAPAKKTPPVLRNASTSASITLNQLLASMPGLSKSRAEQMLPFMNSAMNEAAISSCPRKAAFLAQLGHESASLVYMEEIASGAAYEGRRDLGNTQPGDGKRFKGRGPIQLTGRANYVAAGNALKLNLVGNPTTVATPAVGFRTSSWFWNSKGLNAFADKRDLASFREITRRINGGKNGEADRERRWALSKKALGC